MSKQLDWDAYRYVLEDPTLDRTAFEARMLDDVDLALAVADAVLHIDALRTASFIAPLVENPACNVGDLPVSVPAMSSESIQRPVLGSWHWSTLAALAAALFLAIGLVNYRFINRSADASARQNLAAQSLAESWLAIRHTELVDASSNLVDISTNLEAAQEEDALPGAIEPADDDWLMNAARDFYAQGEAG